MHRRITTCLSLFLLLTVLGGCATRESDPYPMGTARAAQSMHTGVVSAVREITITERPTPFGVILGGATGALAGSMIIGGNPATAGGALIGSYLARSGDGPTMKALSITIDMDNGAVLTVAQEEDDVYLVGDPVRVLFGREGMARVQHQ